MWVIGRIRRPRVWIAVATGVVGAGAFVAVLLLRGSGNGVDQQNAQAVYCLSPQHRADFIQAASNLKLGEPVTGEPDQVLVGTRKMALRDWRVDSEVGDRFRQACAAFAGATNGPAAAQVGGGNTVVTFLLALLTALVPVGLTSWLNYLTTARKDAEAVRRSQTDTLRTAALRFTQAAESYLRLRSNTVESGAGLLATMHERRLELAAALVPVAAASPGWDRPRTLRIRLQQELQGDFVGRVGKIDEKLGSRIRANVDSLAAEAEAVAEAHADTGRRAGTLAGSGENTQVTRS